MSALEWALVGVGAALAVYVLAVAVLYVTGRRTSARAVAGFIPDCAVLFSRLLRDPVVPRRHRVLIVLLLGYLAMPIDLVPDFIPVVGQLDDALFVVLVLHVLLRGAGPELLERHWPGPESSLRVLLRAAGR